MYYALMEQGSDAARLLLLLKVLNLSTLEIVFEVVANSKCFC